MEIWSHDDKLYEVNSGYSLPDDAWQYELVGLTGSPGTGPYIAVAIPDATPDGSFTPKPARDAVVHAGGGMLPWPILANLIDVLNASGDLIEGSSELSVDTPARPLTLNVWWHGKRQFEVNTFHYGERDSWCYELYEVISGSDRNDYIEVRVPDASPEQGPFVPMPADQVTLTMHGTWSIPWPIFRRFIDAIRAAGDIVDPTADVRPK